MAREARVPRRRRRAVAAQPGGERRLGGRPREDEVAEAPAVGVGRVGGGEHRRRVGRRVVPRGDGDGEGAVRHRVGEHAVAGGALGPRVVEERDHLERRAVAEGEVERQRAHVGAVPLPQHLRARGDERADERQRRAVGDGGVERQRAVHRVRLRRRAGPRGDERERHLGGERAGRRRQREVERRAHDPELLVRRRLVLVRLARARALDDRLRRPPLAQQRVQREVRRHPRHARLQPIRRRAPALAREPRDEELRRAERVERRVEHVVGQLRQVEGRAGPFALGGGGPFSICDARRGGGGGDGGGGVGTELTSRRRVVPHRREPRREPARRPLRLRAVLPRDEVLAVADARHLADARAAVLHAHAHRRGGELLGEGGAPSPLAEPCRHRFCVEFCDDVDREAARAISATRSTSELIAWQ